jgi:hypothetical protein
VYLSAYAAQSELGDYDASIHTEGYLSEFRFVPNQVRLYSVLFHLLSLSVYVFVSVSVGVLFHLGFLILSVSCIKTCFVCQSLVFIA